MKSLLSHLTVFALAATAFAVQAADFPTKPVKLMVGYAAGGGTDVIARIIAPALTERWNQQQVIIENRAGASGMLAAEQVTRAAPDGYTLLLGYTPEVSINKLVFKQIAYDPLTDLHPVALVAGAPLYLVVGPRQPKAALKDFVADRNGPALTYGSPGIGGQQHLAGELFQLRTGRKTLHVPYKGAAPAVNDLLGGQLDMFFSSPPVVIQHVKAGKLRALFVTSAQRDAAMPEVPSAAEVGLADFEIANWFGIFGPKGMDPVLVEKIAADLKAVLSHPDIVRRLADNGLSARYMPPAQFRSYVASEMKKYGEIIEKAGLERQ